MAISMPFLSDYPGVSEIWHQSSTLLNMWPYLPDKKLTSRLLCSLAWNMAHFSQNSIFFILRRFLGHFCRNFINEKDYFVITRLYSLCCRHNLILICNVDILAQGPQWTQWITGNPFWISCQPDWQIIEDIFNTPIMAQTQILVHTHRWS